MDHHDETRPTAVGIRLRLALRARWRVHAQAESGPNLRVARAYVRVKQQSELVAQAARAEAPTIALPKPAAHAAAGDSPARRAFSASAGPWLTCTAHGLTALAATALICVMGYGLLRSRSGARVQCRSA